MFVNGKQVEIGHRYSEVEDFLRDMRAGTLKEGFTLTEETFLGLAEAINQDSALAKEVMDQGVLILMATAEGSEVDGLVAMAEACRGGCGHSGRNEAGT